MLGLVGNPKCKECGANMIHLGHGNFCCPRCGYEFIFASDEGFSDTGDYDFEKMGISYDDLYERPDSCIGCKEDFPNCMDGCDIVDPNFTPRLK